MRMCIMFLIHVLLDIFRYTTNIIFFIAGDNQEDSSYKPSD